MDTPTIASANNSQPLSSLSDPNFSKSHLTPSGVPVPVYKQNGRRWKFWIIPLVFLLVAAVGYVFYRIVFLSPEALFVKSVQSVYSSKYLTSQGELTINSPETNNLLYSALSSFGLARQGAFTKEGISNLTIKFNYSSDLSQASNPRRQSTLDWNFSDAQNPETNFNYSNEIKSLDNKTYTSLKGLPDTDDSASGKGVEKWIVQNNTEPTENATETAPPTGLTDDFDSVVSNYINAINILKVKKELDVFAKFESLPSETINGVSSYHFKTHTDKEMAENVLQKLKEQNKLDSSREQSLNDIIRKLTSLDSEFWISKKDFSPQKIIFSLEIQNQGSANEKFLLSIDSLDTNATASVSSPQNTFSPKEFYAYLQQLVLKSESFNEQGYQLMNAGNNAAAQPYLEKAISYNINNFHAYNSLGLVYAGNKDYVTAIKNYQAALQINPEHDKAAINLIAALSGMNDCINTEVEAKKFITKYPQSIFLREAHWWLAEAYRCQQKNDLAVDELNLVLQLDKENPDTYSIYQQLGSNYYQLKKYNEALNSYQKSLSSILKISKPDKVVVTIIYSGIADSYTALKQFNNARATLANSLKYNPQLINDPTFQSQVNGIDFMEKWPH